MSEFEKRLKEFFPEVYELHLLGKDEGLGGGGESHILELVSQLVHMRKLNITGSLLVGYDNGKITNMEAKVNVLKSAKAKRAIDNS